MKNDAKIYLSKEETELVTNKEWLFLKRKIVQKIFALFGALHDDYMAVAHRYGDALRFLPVDRAGKIARGENLHGLPYVMMDYPALFSKDKKVAIRTLFWWGNFFSISLHISGIPLEQYDLNGWLNYFRARGFQISMSDNEWNYEFGDENFLPFRKENDLYIPVLTGHNIFRVAAKFPLQLDTAASGIRKHFGDIIEFLAVNFPDDEKDLLPEFPKADSHP